jgi:hypothetical protein
MSVSRRRGASSANPSTDHTNGQGKPKRTRKRKAPAAKPPRAEPQQPPSAGARQQLSATTPPVLPAAEPNGKDLPAGVVQYTAEDILPAEWFLEPYVPRHNYTLLIGKPGAGKSTFGSHLVARAKRSIVFSGEEDIRRVVLPRLVTAGVDLARVRFVPAGEDWRFSRDPTKLVELIRATPGTELVYVDPLDDYLAESVDEDRNRPVRRVLQCFTSAAEATGIAIVVVRHPGKDPNNLLAGSRAFHTHPRAILHLDLLDDVPDRGIILPHKPPLGRRTPPRYYDLVGGEREPKRFVLGDLVEPGRAVEVREVPARMDRYMIDQAVELLRRLLAGGKEMDSVDIYRAAEHIRLQAMTVRRAAERIGVKRRWEGRRGDTKCHWSLHD